MWALHPNARFIHKLIHLLSEKRWVIVGSSLLLHETIRKLVRVWVDQTSAIHFLEFAIETHRLENRVPHLFLISGSFPMVALVREMASAEKG